MSSALLERAQHLLETTQDRCNELDQTVQRYERQQENMMLRMQTVEGQLAMVRAQMMELIERLRRTHGPEEKATN